MKRYNSDDILRSLKKVGIKKGDLVHVNPEIFKLGEYENYKNKNIYDEIYNTIRKVIGISGTICFNTFTFNTLRKGENFVYENTSSTSGGFSKYILNKKKIVRSKHPVYSITAIGPKAKKICDKNSFHNFGYNSPYEKFVRYNGKVLNLGMLPWNNQYNEVAQYMIGVPYCYNKLTRVNYFKNRKKKNYNFSTFVRYLDFKLDWNFTYLKKELSKKKIVKKSKLGDGYIYAVSAREYLDLCLNLLTKNQFALIKKNYFMNKKKKYYIK